MGIKTILEQELKGSWNSWLDYISLEAVSYTEGKKDRRQWILDAIATLKHNMIRDWERNKEIWMYSKRNSESVEQTGSLKRAGIHYYTKVWGLDEKDSWKKSH